MQKAINQIEQTTLSLLEEIKKLDLIANELKLDFKLNRNLKNIVSSMAIYTLGQRVALKILKERIGKNDSQTTLHNQP